MAIVFSWLVVIAYIDCAVGTSFWLLLELCIWLLYFYRMSVKTLTQTPALLEFEHGVLSLSPRT